MGNDKVEVDVDEEEVPKTDEEPEGNFTRSGGRRASNLNRPRNREVASKEIPIGNKLAESKLQENKITIENYGEVYTIDPEAKTYTIKTSKGEKTFTFDEMDEFVKAYRGSNRIHKPMSVLAYTDYKHNNLKNWGVKTEAVATDKVVDTASVVCTLNLKGEPDNISDGLESVDINIKGVNELTPLIKTAIQQRFGGIFTSNVTKKRYTQDIKVADDLWLTFLDYNESNNTLNFVLDGDMSQDPALNEGKLEENVSQKEYDDILVAIEEASTTDELQDIILAVSDGAVEDEMQNMLNLCIKDKDDIDTVKSLLMSIFEDNTEIEE